eukprot:TRINITY_DN8917_c0_g1_i15.p2 TRINITY_DN8917_c0_g1~~TRINITY_DN8917_c0_g1_i15.p2  ORF type:complete len:244 (-),score=-16.55 TRINITY_DN8917_c0_g1_i15:45-776(-)
MLKVHHLFKLQTISYRSFKNNISTQTYILKKSTSHPTLFPTQKNSTCKMDRNFVRLSSLLEKINIIIKIYCNKLKETHNSLNLINQRKLSEYKQMQYLNVAHIKSNLPTLFKINKQFFFPTFITMEKIVMNDQILHYTHYFLLVKGVFKQTCKTPALLRLVNNARQQQLQVIFINQLIQEYQQDNEKNTRQLRYIIKYTIFINLSVKEPSNAKRKFQKSQISHFNQSSQVRLVDTQLVDRSFG